MRSLKSYLLLLLTVGLIGYVGSTSVAMADQTDPPHQAHLVYLRGPGMGGGGSPCLNCHTSGQPGQGDVDLATCNVCHSPDGPYGWAAEDLKNLFWYAGAYDEDGNIRDERWCASCHDTGISEQRTINGRLAKQVTGDQGKEDGDNYGYFISGHKFACTVCHDSSLAHIDAYARTYHAWDCETDPSRTYRMGYRLNLVNGQDPLVIPRRTDYDSSLFRLCYQCHDESRITGYNPIQTYFANLSTAVGYGSLAPDPPNNIHMELHLARESSFWDSDLRGDYWNSRMSCPTCHDPHSKKAYGAQLHKDRATHSMTRADMGIVHRREVRGWSAWTDSNDFTLPDGDLHCMACHNGSEEEPAGPRRWLYYFLLGTALTDGENPALYTKLDNTTDITNLGGDFLGGNFEQYTRNCTTKTGLLIDAEGEGLRLPISSLSLDQEVIDFWYVPNFDFSTSSGTHFLVDAYGDGANYLRIKVVDRKIWFTIQNQNNTYRLKSTILDWTANEPHHIVCTWGPSAGMHMYLDRDVEGYDLDGGTGYTGGLNGAMLPAHFYIGRDEAGTSPANGILDDFKLYGYQYQKFEQGPAFFSKLGSYIEIQNPVAGDGGSYDGIISFRDTNNPPDGYALRILDSEKGVVEFPTSNLNPAGDTIDFWWGPYFDVYQNADTTKHLFYCSYDTDNFCLIKVQNKTLWFRIKVGGTPYTVQTEEFPDYAHAESNPEDTWYTWVHVVCCWGPKGMRIYINGEEAKYKDDSGKSYTGGLPPLPEKFQIGNKNAGGNSYMDSMMDELRIYGYQETEFPQEPQKEWTPHGGPLGLSCFDSTCHAMNKMHAAHFVSDPGPGFPLDETGCNECHADGRLQCQGRPLFSDSNFLEVTDVCDACHNRSCP
jgi:hypothetical protein